MYILKSTSSKMHLVKIKIYATCSWLKMYSQGRSMKSQKMIEFSGFSVSFLVVINSIISFNPQKVSVIRPCERARGRIPLGTCIKLVREISYRDSFRCVLFRGRKDFAGIENLAAANAVAVDRYTKKKNRDFEDRP